MKGNELLPLSHLEKVYRAKFDEEMMKYEEREWLNVHTLPMLECKWHDCVQFSIIDPLEIKAAMASVGLKFSGEFFQIDPKMFPTARSCVFLYENEIHVGEPWNQLDFVPFDPAYLEQYAHLSSATLAHYADCAKRKVEPMPWYRTPHVLLNGPLNIKHVRRITV
jgi:hypothetical protein